MEQKLKAEIARLTQMAQEKEGAHAASSLRLQQATKEVESLKRQLEDANRLLDSERTAAVRLRNDHAKAQQDGQVRRLQR
jgi:hypothetical protein